MTQDRAIDLLKTELSCVRRNENGLCDRDCASCDLVQQTSELIEMYEFVISHMEKQNEQR